jgi:hypothetical protein
MNITKEYFNNFEDEKDVDENFIRVCDEHKANLRKRH